MLLAATVVHKLIAKLIIVVPLLLRRVARKRLDHVTIEALVTIKIRPVCLNLSPL